MTEQLLTVADAKAFLEKNPTVQWIDLFLFDLNGVPRGKRLRRGDLLGVAEGGIMLPASVFIMDPRGTALKRHATHMLCFRPGADVALLNAMMHVVVAEDLVHSDFLRERAEGYEELKARALEWTPERTAETCGITAGEVVELARVYGQTARSGEGAAIRMNYGLQRVRGGGMAVRKIACLPALVGAWRHKAGGVQLSTSGSFPANRPFLQRPDLLNGRMARTINMTTIHH